MKFQYVLVLSPLAIILAGEVPADTAPLPRQKPEPSASQSTSLPPPPVPSVDLQAEFQSCSAALKSAGVEFTPEPVLVGEQDGCAIAFPVKLNAVRAGNAMVKLPAAPLLNCGFALRLAQWVGGAAAPLMAFYTGSALQAVSTGPGYQCRRRNRSKTGKLSEHAKGNAIDITGFVPAKGKRLAIAKRATGTKAEKKVLTSIGMTACGYFSTVLGPGSNAAHDEHFHFDHAKRGKNWNYRLCE